MLPAPSPAEQRPPRGPRPRLPAALLLWALLASPASGASFFGENHLEVPLNEVLNEIHVKLQFFTAQADALLLLLAGPTDHLLVELHAGRLQVHLVQRNEETLLQSPEEMPLSDLGTHDVAVTVADGQVSLTVDDLFNSSSTVAQAPLEASYGIFVGGSGGLHLSYLAGASRPLRGCLQEASLNGLDLLARLTEGVRDGCAAEFSASEDEALGFTGPRALAAFPTWSTRDEGTLEFTLTTRVKRAPLAYQAGGPQGDFIYLEIFDGHLRAIVEKGHGAVMLHNSVSVTDGQPHEVSVHVDVHMLEISVDQYPTRTSNRGVHSYLEPRGSLLLGGLDEEASRRLREHRLGLASAMANASLVGCLEDLIINGERQGLQGALVTRDVTAGCGLPEEEYEDDAYEVYEVPSTLVPEGWPLLEMPEPCTLEPGLPAIFANFTKLLTLTPLVVAEGGTAWLEWRHVQPTLDLSEVGIRQSQVLFSLAREAQHGELDFSSIPGAQSRKKFTLLDVVNRKIRFIHDGSEYPEDQLVLEVTVMTQSTVPQCLRQGQTYILPIRVNPLNDPPRVVFPHGNLMVILEHTQKALGPEVFQAYDPDTDCESLTFQLIGSQHLEGGTVEREGQPGERVAEFSCPELEAGALSYVHRGGPAQDLLFRVTDGLDTSPVAVLRVVAIQPALQILNNTGLLVPQGSSAAISTANLSAETNAVNQEVTVLYRLSGSLLYGEIQKAGGAAGSDWRAIDAFSQRDVEQGQVRYLSTDPQHHAQDITEKVVLQVQVGQKVLANATFPVTIQRAAIRMLRLAPLLAHHTRQEVLSTEHLEAALEDESGPGPASFHYEIVQAPRKGNLRLRSLRLTEKQGFTQKDLEEGHVNYRATARASEEAQDSFLFRVTAPPHFSPLYTFPIRIGGDPDAPILTNVLLSVPEGGRGAISRDHLFVQSLNSANYLYEVIEQPRHGSLVWQGSGPKAAPVTTFTNDDLLLGRLLYQHDDSETTEDDIPFVAVRQGEGSGGMAWEEVRGVFRVAIQPMNDHAPVQTVSRVFHVARGGRRLLTTEDVAFTDADSGFTDAQLVLTRKDLLFGSIVAADDPGRPVYRFTQEDLRKKRVLFVHSGADRGWIQLQVSDGQHQSTALLEVQASEPYLRITNNSGLAVPQGGQGTIDTSVLGLDTNVDIRSSEEVHYRVTAAPRWGQLLRAGKPATAFSQRDLLEGAVLYQHNGSRNPQDALGFSVEAGQVTAEDTLKVTVTLDRPLAPLQMVHQEKIFVFQGEAAEIKTDLLEVAQEDVPAAEIVYKVTDSPRAGYLVTVSQGASANEPPSLDPVHSFTQEDVNEGRVLYLHSQADGWTDRFTLDVASSVGTTLEGVQVELQVLPVTIPLEIQNFSVPEGGAHTLAPPVLRVTGPYFPTLTGLEFLVLEPPQHGTIKKGDTPQDENLSTFTWKEVEQKLIHYVHDGSETLMDSFVLVANASEIDRQSQPVSFSITVLPLNDQVPTLPVNTGVQMWEGAIAQITPDILKGEDADSPPEDLVFSIEPPTNGKLVLRLSPRTEIQQFTQAQINNGLVQFVHEGPLDGGFHFNLSDGENVSPGHFFSVKAQKLRQITVESNQALTICPGSFQTITNRNLKVTTNEDTDPQHLFYLVERGPRLGRLAHSRLGSSGDALKNFTQAEVDAGEILYEHEMPSEPFWLAQDTLGLRVSSPPARDVAISLSVAVSFEIPCSQRASRLWKNEGLWVPEGQRAEITRASLDASNLLASIPAADRPSHNIVFIVTELPTHGELWVGNNHLGGSQPYFLQSDLARGQLAYIHRGSGTQRDGFHFQASIQTGQRDSAQPPIADHGPVISETFQITVRDVNEKPPQPQASRPLQIVRGTQAALSRAQLSALDPDSSPEEIEYQVRRAPHNGHLLLVGSQPPPVARFTQADVDAGRLIFVANGSSTLGIFQLSVSDGASPPVDTSLSVDVLPSSIEVRTRSPLEVPQGSNWAVVTQQHLFVISDQEEPDATYSLTHMPQHGHLLVSGRPQTSFSQKQVEQGEVAFSFTNFTSASDHFRLLSLARGANASAAVNVTVRALVQTRAAEPWPQGATILLDTGILDAGELANRTQSMPQFRVLQGPRRGRVVRIPEERDQEPRAQPVELFTLQDLQEGRIGLELSRPEGREPPRQHDGITFELSARGVPPAVASLDYMTEPYDASRPYGVTLLTSPGSSEASSSSRGEDSSSRTVTGPKGPERPTPDSREAEAVPTSGQGQAAPTSAAPAEGSTFLGFIEANMFSIIIPICLILLLLALILPLLFYLRKRNKTGKHNVQGLSAKPRNGLAADSETFRKTDPSQTIPLTSVPGKGPEARSPQDPELLQFCRTPNPALKNGQYWV
ncbi:LOW QUALITY PROTEIN: chondroitin sulfate proteoglycan 4 [Sminthopsis crassicaudata]|uniref:LOW QUALITY PROTEIN: chondroitin sulfate proteoglycan 4 n=1 Tax=Sminthopsis crassicaudata TaxID=9301 RepID=UPI003D69FCF5